MSAIFSDHEDLTNPFNGRRINSTEAISLLRSLQGREPFICSLDSEFGSLLVGIGRELGCVQFTPGGGGPPYLVASTGSTECSEEYVDFLSGGTPSPIPRRNCLAWAAVERIVTHFLDQGGVPSDIIWEEV
jgi:hypothetical protein